MTFAYWCVLAAAFMPLAWTAAAKVGAGSYDNRRPRAFLESLSGWPQRANWAQQNALEAFPPFAAAVIIANLAHAAPERIDLLAGLFILFRILHGVFYISDRSTLRSFAWLGGFICVVALFVSGA